MDWRLPIAYGAAFMLAILMPGRRSLFLVAVVVGLPLVGIMVYLNTRPQWDSGGGGVDLFLAFIVYLSTGIGLGVGVVTRFITLGLREWGLNVWKRSAVTVIGVAALPLIAVGVNWLNEWSRRPPSQACLDSVFNVELGGTILRLPPVPLFSVTRKSGYIYSFRSNASLRQFCSLARPVHDPVRIVSISIWFDEMRRGQWRMFAETFCEAPSGDWGRRLCSVERGTEVPFHPIKASVYALNEYDHRRMLASSRSSYAGFLEDKARLEAGGYPPPRSEPFGIFVRYSNGYWIARPGTWPTHGREPYTLGCRDTTPDGTLYCSSTYRLESGIQITYDFRAPSDRLEETARLVDRNLREMVSELSRPDEE